MQVDYAPFIDRVIQRYEGGYGWDKGDPGGPTKYGITCFDLAEHRGQKMTSMAAWVEPVKNMTLAEAAAIYATKYAGGIRFDDLNAGPDVVMLDYGINSGNSRPINVARQLVQCTGNTGRMDSDLVKAINAVDPKWFVDSMCQERLRFMHAIKGGAMWREFGHGWGSRVSDLTVYGEHLAAGGTHTTAPPAPDLSKVVTPKATNVPKTAGKATAGGAVTTGVALHTAGFHWIPTAIAVAAIGMAGLGYEVFQEYAAEAANAKVHL
jgi:lysozyme family protein